MTFNAPSLVVTILGLVVILLSTILVLRSTSFTIDPEDKVHNYGIHSGQGKGLYEDEDGTATTGCEERFSARFFKITLLVCAIISVLLSLSTGIWSSRESEQAFLPETWLLFCAWVLILVQVCFLILETLSTRRFEIGLCVSSSSIVLVICTAFNLIVQVKARAEDSVSVAIAIAQLIFGIIISTSSLLIPRRPEVYQDGKIVDAQYTCSALERFTFTWARPILDQAKIRGLEYSDLPALDHGSRSFQLHDRFPTVKDPESLKNMSLWRLLLRDHSRVFILQWTLTAVESLMMIVPQICLFQILQLLQQRNKDDHVPISMWLYVAGLGISKMVHVGLETWVKWLSFALLAVPIRAQLCALVFTKSMKMKDIKSTPGSKPRDSSRSTDDAEGAVVQTEEEVARQTFPSPTEDAAHNEVDESESEAFLEAKQGAINLVAVDAQRISDFCGFNSELPGTLLKVTLAVAFLVRLIGWYAVLAGLAVPVVFQPLNSIAAKRYAAQQSEVMAARDNKSNVVTEALQGIRQIKFSAIEPQWQTVILAARTRELDAQWRAYLWAIYLTFCWYAMPIFLGAAALAVYAWLNGGMTAAIAFTSLAVFTKLEFSLSVTPTNISELLNAYVSIKRIQQHLESPEKQAGCLFGDCVVLEKAEISWPADDESHDTFRLRNINLQLPIGELSVVHGKTGSGKSLLLAALLGEANVTSGKIVMPRPNSTADRQDIRANRDNWILPSSVAFVSQIPWLEDGSIKQNILFGLPLDAMRYEKVLSACALIDDLKMLPDGELTEIGASGINLSGGQRWRVTIARAVYSRAGILVLDDIFSAVDAHVGRHILEHCLTGELACGRTRILVTHHIELVSPYCRYLVQLGDDGSITRAETREITSLSDNASVISSVSSLSAQVSEDVQDDRDDKSKAEAKKFIEEEKREKGRVSTTILLNYFRSSGLALWALTFAVFALVPVAILGRAWWVKLWTEDTKMQHSSLVEDSSSTHLTFYLGVYLGISLIASVIVCIKIYMICAGSLRASKILFEEITFKVLRAELRWLDTVPLGRILNRFVSDFSFLDSRLAGDLQYFWTGALSVGAITVAGLFVTPFMIVPLVVLGLLCLYCINIYLNGARDIKRLESSARSPVFELYGSALMGLATIRSFDRTEDYFRRMFERIDTHSASAYGLWLTNRWMAFRMGIVGSLFAFCVAASVGLTRIDASLAGFALSFALDYSDSIINCIQRYAGLELDMNSTERIVEYTSMETEDQSGADPPASWPTKGCISISDLEVGYAPNLPSILRGVTFAIEPNSRIGVVGRTGSGKTSLTLALFRFVEARKGQINIDGIDISKLKLHELRSRLAIIPQDPVLFSGTLRSNLDPFNDHTDDELRDALKRVYLINQEDSNANVDPDIASAKKTTKPSQRNTNPFANLSNPISQAGLNLSQGQRQLLCLARAIVTRPKIIILDEATSAVDMATDALIQKSIREQFKDSTLLVIAHRLSTISDFDKVLVMSEGRVVEFDEPRVLMAKRGVFAGMVGESGERGVLEGMIHGGGG